MNKNLKIAILIVVLISAVFGGYFAWGFLKKPKNQNNQQNGQISDLKTYRNEKYGFEFKYPKEWILKEEIQDNQFSVYFKSEEDLKMYKDQANTLMFISLDDNPQKFSIEEYYDGDPGGDLFVHEVCDDNQYGIRYISGKKSFVFFPCTSDYETTIIPLESSFISISVIASSSTLSIGNDIINTLNIKNSASDLKTYKNEKYGFEFQYPGKKLNLHEYLPNTQINKFRNMVLDLNNPTPGGGFGRVDVYNTNFQFIDSIIEDAKGRFSNIISSKDSNFDNKPGKIFTSKIVNYNGEGYEEEFYKTILIQYADDKVISIWGPSYTEANKEQDILFGEIVSTLKFFDVPKTNASNLKTYRNEKFGFEFKYPKEIVISSGDTEEGDLYFEFCNDVSCFMAPDFFETQNTEITDINKITDKFNYNEYCYDLNDKGEPVSGFIKDKKIVSSLDGKKGILLHFNEDGYCTVIQFLNGNKLFSFVIGEWKEQKLDEVILSSFKFIK